MGLYKIKIKEKVTNVSFIPFADLNAQKIINDDEAQIINFINVTNPLVRTIKLEIINNPAGIKRNKAKVFLFLIIFIIKLYSCV